MWENEKMLIASNFSFSHNVFQMLLSWDCSKSGLCGKELTGIVTFSQHVFYPMEN